MEYLDNDQDPEDPDSHDSPDNLDKPEDPKTPDTPDKPTNPGTKKSGLNTRLTETGEPPEGPLSRLTPYQRALASLDLVDNPSSRPDLPGDSRLVVVKIPRDKKAKLEGILTRHKIPRLQQTDFTGDGNAKHSFVTLLTPNLEKAEVIHTIITRSDIPTQTTIIDTPEVPILRIDELAAIHPAIQQNDEPFKKSTLTKIPHTDPEDPKPGNPTYSSRDLIKKALEQKVETPTPGPCEFLVINTNRIEDPETITRIKGQLSSLTSSETYFVPYNGLLIAMATSERAASQTRRIARVIAEDTEHQAIQWYGAGKIAVDKKKGISIEGFPSLEQLERTANLDQGMNIYIDPSYTGRERDRTHFEIETETVEDGISVITKIEYQPGYTPDGPEILIDQEKTFENLVKWIDPTNRKVRLVSIIGKSGGGKSRLLYEVEKNLPPESLIRISLIAGQENNPGFEMMSVAEQVAEQVETLYNEIVEEINATSTPDHSMIGYLKMLKDNFKPLIEFKNQTDEEKIKSANSDSETLIENITNAIRGYELGLNRGKETMSPRPCLIRFDDTHHAGLGDKDLMGLMESILAGTSSTVVKAKRDDESHHQEEEGLGKKQISADENKLEAWAKRRGLFQETEVIPLDFKEDIEKEEESRAYRYILWSIPAKDRFNIVTEKLKTLDEEGYKRLAKLANTPLDMTTFLTDIIDSDGLIIGDDKIQMKPEAIDQIEKDGGGGNEVNIVRYHMNRIKRVLTPEQQSLLLYIAMLETNVSFDQLITISKELLGIQNPGETITLLNNKGFIESAGSTEDQQTAQYRLRHESLRPVLLNNLFEKEDKALASTNLLEFLKEDETVPARVKVFLAQHVTKITPIDLPENETFWGDYIKNAETTLRKAVDSHQYGRSFALAMNILEHLEELEENDETSTSTQLKALRTEELKEISKLQLLIVNALITAAENGFHTGRFSSVHETIDILKEIIDQNPTFQANTKKMHEIGFDTAYAERDTKKMEAYLKTLAPLLSKPELFVANLKVEYRKAGDGVSGLDITALNKLQTRYESESTETLKNATPETLTEAHRIFGRVVFELFRATLGGDDDIQMRKRRPEELPDAIPAFFQSVIKTIETSLEQNRREPGKLSPVTILQSLDLLAQMLAFSGLHSKEDRRHTTDTEPDPGAIEAFGELIMIARRIENPDMEVRASHLKGDLEFMQAFACSETAPDIKWLLQSLATYHKGLAIVEQEGQIRENSEYRLIARNQPIRVTAEICKNYRQRIEEARNDGEKGKLEHYVQKLTGLIASACKSFKFMNKDPYCIGFAEMDLGPYYTAPMAYVIDTYRNIKPDLDRMGISIMHTDEVERNLSSYPFTKAEAIAKGKSHAEELSIDEITDPLNEISRKATHLNLLEQLQSI